MAYDPIRQVCIYVVAEEGSAQVCKIGITELLARRIGSMQSHNWRKLSIPAAFAVSTTDVAYEVEQAILHKFDAERIRGEWIRISPERLADEIEDHLRSIGIVPVNVFKSQSSIVIKLWSNQ